MKSRVTVKVCIKFNLRSRSIVRDTSRVQVRVEVKIKVRLLV